MSKDAGFKVVTHMMPDLPNVGLERDIEQFIVSLPLDESIVLLFCLCVYSLIAQVIHWLHFQILNVTKHVYTIRCQCKAWWCSGRASDS